MPSPRVLPLRSPAVRSPAVRTSAVPARPPARPDVRDRILEEATRLFAARGFEGTSLADVAAAVGLRKPSLLYHYPSKDELRGAVLEHLLERWNDVLPRLLLAATSGEGRFDAVLQEMIGFFSADPDRARILVREALDRPVEMGELVAMHTPPWVEMVSGYIRRGQAEGLIHRDVDPEAYVIQVVNLVIAGIATWDCIGAISGKVARAERGRPGPGGAATGSPSKKSREAAARLPARHVAEMLRMAKAALFVSVPVPVPPWATAESHPAPAPARASRVGRGARGLSTGKKTPQPRKRR